MFFKSFKAPTDSFGTWTSSRIQSDRRSAGGKRRPARRRICLETLEDRTLLSVFVATDQTDYAPGSTALISGGGFQPGDAITLQVVHTDGNPNVSPANDPWTVTADDSGNISSSWYVDPASSTGDTLELQANDPTTGDSAVADFTDAITLSQTTAAEGSAAFSLTITASGTTRFTTSGTPSQITWNGSPLTTTSLTSTSITATVPTSDTADEGTASVTVNHTTGTTPGSQTFTITDADSITPSTINISATQGTAYTGILATFTDTFTAQTASEFKVSSINWSDGTTTPNPAATIAINNTTGVVTVSNVSHTWTDEGLFTTVKTATAIPMTGTWTLPVANNGTNGFPTSGSIGIYTLSGGFQTVTYTGVTTGTSASFTGVSGGSGTLAVGSPITHAMGQVSVTLAPADAQDTWGPVTATGSVAVSDAGTVTLTKPTRTFTEAVAGTVSASFTDTGNGLASDYVATINWNDGSPVQLCTVAGSAGSYTITSPSHIYPQAGAQSYTLTLSSGDGASLASGGNTITVNDAAINSFYGTNVTVAAGSNNVTLPLVNGTISTASLTTSNWPSSGTINVTTAAGVTTNLTYTGISGYPSYGFTGVNGGVGVLKTGDYITLGVSATEGAASPKVQVLAKFSDPGTLIAAIASTSNGLSLPQSTINIDSTVSVTNFPTSGTLLVVTSNGVQTVNYTGQSAPNTFTGCTGGTGVMSTGNAVTFGGGSVTGYPGEFSGTTINWGDGTNSPGTVTWVGYGNYSVTGGHTYAEEGSYQVQTTIRDSGGSAPFTPSAINATVLVSDPNVVVVGVPTITSTYGSALGVQTLATFTDPGGPEANDGLNYTASVNWGGAFGTLPATITYDGVSTYTVTASVPYVNANTYSPIVTVSHDASTPQSVTDTLTVNKADQTITWSNPASILYGTALSSTQLNATVAVPGPDPAGALTYTPGVGAIVGSWKITQNVTLSVSAAATANYNAATATVSLTVVDLITNLENQVSALVASSVLSSSDGSLLTSKLAAAAADFNLSTPDIAGGDALMNAFTSQVTVFLNQHKLTSAQAQPLVTASKVIIADSKTIG